MHKYQKQIDKWFQEQGWEYWKLMDILARLTEEVGEFA
jgi:NTP pyrophosphatase (non-canonical NTP hydrolase)